MENGSSIIFIISAAVGFIVVFGCGIRMMLGKNKPSKYDEKIFTKEGLKQYEKS